jgi:hypothetical protein
MENTEITVDLNNRLLKIQEEIQSITKDKTVPYKKIDYVSDKGVNEAFKPLFDKHEVLFYVEAIDYQMTFCEKPVNRGKPDFYLEPNYMFIVKCNMVFETNKERKVIPYLGADANGFEDGLQGAITSTRRAFLLKFFNVVQVDNNNNNNNQGTNNQQGRNHSYQKQTPPPQLSEADKLVKKMNEYKTLAEYNSIFDRVMTEGEKDVSIKRIYWDIAKKRGYKFDETINKFRKKDD